MKLLKKRIPALFLVLLVVLSLTVPALAAGCCRPCRCRGDHPDAAGERHRLQVPGRRYRYRPGRRGRRHRHGRGRRQVR